MESFLHEFPLPMERLRTITYDEKADGCRVLSFPPELPFESSLDELRKYLTSGTERDGLVDIAEVRNIYERAEVLVNHLSMADDPAEAIFRVAALAAEGDPAGIRLMNALMLAIPPEETIVGELADFPNVMRVMDRINRKEQTGGRLRESEEWFRKKVILLSMSHPLPAVSSGSESEPWHDWSEGVRKAIDDPDRRWRMSILERVRVELEAMDFRVKMIVVSIDPELHERLTIFLHTLSEEIRWKLHAIEKAGEETSGATLIVHRKLGERWVSVLERLRGSDAGTLLADLFEYQSRKSIPFPQVKSGTAVLRALLMNPLIRTGKKTPDFLSCLALFTGSAGKGFLKLMIPSAKKFESMLNVPGFSLDEKILTVDLRMIPAPRFVGEDEVPIDVEWMEIGSEKDVSYKSLVLTYIDNDSFLLQLLNNPKAVGKPGVISVIALRCRSSSVLTLIAHRREYYTGFANKDVPMNLLMNPVRVPMTALRKFIHVRYVDRVSLQRMATRGSSVREEIRQEIYRYLSSVR